MDKSKITENNNTKCYSGNKEQLKNYEVTKEPIKESPKKYEQSVYLKHRCNESVEYKWKGEYHKFGSYERQEFNKDILEDKNFKKSQKYFTVEK